jgi:phage shock protein PspC (stress-responsive transcriptional regulator)
MKKIININLSGRVVPIEDSAYEKLQAYIDSLRKYFAREEGRDEIINDIESRIAELMSEKIRLGVASISEADVDQIIASMGRPEDFDAATIEDETFQAQPAKETYKEKKRRGRLYRDTSDKFLGGVCSGIANYLNIDPAIVRILFAIITFGGFGLGILGYIILWLILPGRDLDSFEGKRLYRNPDDRIIGGVAGGLAAYFNRSATTIRIIFALPLIINILFGILNGIFDHNGDFFALPNIFFGSFTGTFILAYVILWMVLPEARSTYDKMEMRGEKVDVNTIRQNVQEGIDSMKGRVKTFASEAGSAAKRGGSGLGHAIGVLFRVFFLFIAGSIAFALFVAMIALIFGGIAWWPVNNFLWTSNSQQVLAWGTLIFFFLVPLIAFITWVVRRILRVRSRRTNYLGWTFAGLWTIGWICAALFASSVANDLREYEHTDMPLAITQPANNRMVVMVSEPRLEYSGNFGWIDNDAEGWDLSMDTLKLSIVRFDIQKSFDDSFHVIVKKYSAGRNRREALERADKILYSIGYRDSILDIGSGYAIDKQSKFRGQKIEIEIQVPEGKRINFHETVKARINPANIRVYREEGWRKRGVDIQIDEEESFPWQSNVDYIMGSDGELRDAAGNRVDENYRYKTPPQQPVDSIETREQKKKRLEEELKKLNEDNTKSLPPKTTGFIKTTTIQKNNDVAAGSPSVMFSMTDMWN